MKTRFASEPVFSAQHDIAGNVLLNQSLSGDHEFIYRKGFLLTPDY